MYGNTATLTLSADSNLTQGSRSSAISGTAERAEVRPTTVTLNTLSTGTGGGGSSGGGGGTGIRSFALREAVNDILRTEIAAVQNRLNYFGETRVLDAVLDTTEGVPVSLIAQVSAMEYSAFGHGTSLESAENIMKNGLSAGDARLNAQRGGVYYGKRGDFFTFGLGQPGAVGPGLEYAYDMGKRKADRPVILILILPARIVANFEKKGLITIDSGIPGFSAPQITFSSRGYRTINKYATWQILDPYKKIRIR